MKQIIRGEEITVEVDLEHGARLSSVQWQGFEFSVQKRENPLSWGWYPMIPWAGRVLHGKFRHANGDVEQLRTDVIPPHAIHGLGYLLPWRDCGNGVSRIDFPAPYASASAELRISVAGNVLNYELEYFPGECDLPAWVGVHTWFPRRIGGADSGIDQAQVLFDAEKMLKVDETLMPDGQFIAPITPQPWDDVFHTPIGKPTTLWPGGARLEVTSSTPWWVVYTLDSEGVCIEPQTAPPNAQNLGIDLSDAHILRAQFTFTRQS
ncbi:MAG: galactose mutarotase [Actinobacteria bacterium]|nr:galactose mutarotase [Actinomycetota bacterium]